MDTRELTRALREATGDIEPRPNLAADVLRGGRRRRSRNRFTIGAAVAGTAAAAIAAMTVLPNHLAAPPPADQPLKFSLMDRSGGSLIDDESVTRAAISGWTDGIAGNAGEAAGISPENLRGEPHVFWASNTDYGVVAIVAQEATLSDGVRTVVSGAVANNPYDDRPDELELFSAAPGVAAFLLPDNKTLVTPEGDQGFLVSSNLTVNEEGRSEWQGLRVSPSGNDTAHVMWLGDLRNPYNLRIDVGPTTGQGGNLPVSLPLNTPEIRDRGLPWPAEALHVPEPRDLPRPAWEIFRDGLRDSELLDPASYTPGEPRWTVAADLPDGRTLILGEHQELDNPAWVFAVLMRPDGSVETVRRMTEIDPNSAAPVIAEAPDGQGTVVAAEGQPIAYRTSADGSWDDLGNGAALVPADASDIRVGDTVIPLD